jgi:hypothetical protein
MSGWVYPANISLTCPVKLDYSEAQLDVNILVFG